MSTQKRRMSLKKEEQEKLLKVYEKALTELKSDTEKLIKNLSNTAESERFKQIVDIANASIQFYAEDLKNIMLSNYQAWRESKVSIAKQVEASLAGDNAVLEAKSLEKNFERKIEEMYKNMPGLIKVDDTTPNIDPEKMEQIKQEITNYVEKLNGAERKHRLSINKYAEENQLFIGIQGHVSATFTAAHEGFAARATQVKGLADELSNILKQAAADMEQANSDMKKKGVNSAKNLEQFPKPRFQ
ncbi:MAG: hypothetical protein HFG54_10885 [Lachnospiraceae bacterium]|jgi:hypothetical protein|nr:hypothetical protein [Lachnospiraceae bacterium]